MFTYLSSWVWGAQEETDADSALETAAVVEHSTHEEEGEWLVVTTGGAEPTADVPKSGGTTSQESECERESVCSDGSWIITPAPTFRVTGSQAAPDHPLENLLIEHPTMSVYGQMTRGTTERPEDEEEAERERERAQQAREMVILRNRQRMQVAEQLQLPLAPNKNRQIRPKADQVRVTRRAARRLNSVRQRNNRGRQTVIMKKCTFVAGRRRC